MSDYFDRPSREPPWPRLFNRLKERKVTLAALILAGDLDRDQYQHQTGRYMAVTQVVEEMQAMMRGEDLPKKTEMPSVE